MNMEDVKKVQWRAKLLPDIALCIVPNRADLITSFKQRAVDELLEEHPSITFMEIYFDIQNALGQELHEAVEYFRRGDRFMYDGEFMSRSKLESIISQLPATLTMTAWIKEPQ